MSLAFDTHQYIKKLEKVGFPEEQAEVTVKMFSEVLDGRERTYRQNLASKQDLKDEIATLQIHLEEKIHGLEEKIHDTQISQEEKIHGLEVKIHESQIHLEEKIHNSQISQEEKIYESRVSQELKIHELALKITDSQRHLEEKIYESTVSMIKWFTGVMIAQAASIVALIKLL